MKRLLLAGHIGGLFGLAALMFLYEEQIHAISESFPVWVWIAVLVLGLYGWAKSVRKYFGKRRELKRESRGLCISCGYDLRATVEKCPECGATPKADESS